MAKGRDLTATFAVDWITHTQVCSPGTGSGDIVYRKLDGEDDSAAGFALFFRSPARTGFADVAKTISIVFHVITVWPFGHLHFFANSKRKKEGTESSPLCISRERKIRPAG